MTADIERRPVARAILAGLKTVPAQVVINLDSRFRKSASVRTSDASSSKSPWVLDDTAMEGRKCASLTEGNFCG